MNFDKPRWTPEETAKLLELSDLRIHQVEIGIRLGRSECAVRGRLARIRAKKRKMHGSPSKRDKEDAERLRSRGWVCRDPRHRASPEVQGCSAPLPARCTRVSPRLKAGDEKCGLARRGPEHGGGTLML